MNKCFIIGAGEADDIEIHPDKTDFIICADGGLKLAERFSITPDMVVGDFDSYGSIPDFENIEVHPAEKDETDSLLAVDIALEKGYRDFVLYAVLGGRLDHTFANLQLLSYLCKKGAKACLMGDGCRVMMLKDSSITFSKDERGIISVFSFSPESRGVYLKGLKYELSDYTMTSSYPIGVSNEFLGCEATVCVESGELLIILENEN